MKIFRAVKSNILTQGFGIENTKPELLPLYNSLGLKAHEGWDWAVDCKDRTVKHGGQCENVYCDLDCKSIITQIQISDENGYGIVSQSEDQEGIFHHLWWHFDVINPDLKVGSVLESGTLLGVAGNTGRTSGPHLHRELRPMERDTYGNVYKLQPTNGYGGAIDMTPYFDDKFVLDVLDGLKQQINILQKLIDLFKKLFKGR